MIEDVTVYIDSEGRPWKRTTNNQGFYEKFSRIPYDELELEPLILGIECKFYRPKGRTTKRKDWYP